MNWMTSGKKRLSKKQMQREGGFLAPQRYVVKSNSNPLTQPNVGTTVNLGGGERSTDVIRLKSQWKACTKKSKVQPVAGVSHGIPTASKNAVQYMASAHEHRAPVSTVHPRVEQDVKFFNDGIPVEVILHDSNRIDKQSSQYHNYDQEIDECGNGGGDTSLKLVYYCSILLYTYNSVFC